MKTKVAFLTLLALLLLAAPAAAKQGGHLDRGFGKNGKLVLPPRLFGSDLPANLSSTFQKGGVNYQTYSQRGALGGMKTKLLPLGKGRLLLAHGNRLVELTKSGQLDPAFGDGGVLVVPSPAGEQLVASDVSIDPAGRILVSGEAANIGAAPDETPFGDAPSNDPRRSYYRFGTLPTRALVMRLLPNGQLDPSFGNGGFVDSTFGLPAPVYDSRSYATAVVGASSVSTDSQGRVTIAGRFATSASECYPSINLTFYFRSFVARAGVGGNLEYVSADPAVASSHISTGLTSAGGDRVLFEGSTGAECQRGGFEGPAILSLLDSTGAATPGVALAAPGYETSPATAFDQKGRLVLSGLPAESAFKERAIPVVSRLRPNGSLDTGFGAGGRRYIPGFSNSLAVAIDAHNRPVVAVSSTEGNAFGLIRLTAKGVRDHRFSRGGSLAIPFRSAKVANAEADLVDGAGRVAVAGEVTLASGAKETVALARYVPGAR